MVRRSDVIGYLPPEEMSLIYKIRQEYAKALAAWETNPSPENLEAFTEITERRDRAYRMLAEDGYGIRQISAMFRSSKTSVRIALGEKVGTA